LTHFHIAHFEHRFSDAAAWKRVEKAIEEQQKDVKGEVVNLEKTNETLRNLLKRIKDAPGGIIYFYGL
jgi:hypothetical protein